MSLMWRDPFEMATPLRDVMNRLFEESFIRPERLEIAGARSFPLDISESDDKQQFIIEANVAGFKPEDIQITSAGDTLTIRAEKKGEARAERGGYVRRERYAGEMVRTVTLPTHIDEDKVQASCEHGVLTVIVPKAAGAQPKQIPVRAEGH